MRVLVLSGRGRAFCAGDDLTADTSAAEDPLKGRRVDLEMGAGPAFLLESAAVLRACPKPTVALLHGHALGSGYDYSLSCDFRLATADVNYGDPRIHRGLWAAEGWSYKLPRLVNQSAVAPIAYLGKTMDGQTAHDFGLVHRVYPAGADLRVDAKPFLDALSSARRSMPMPRPRLASWPQSTLTSSTRSPSRPKRRVVTWSNQDKLRRLPIRQCGARNRCIKTSSRRTFHPTR